MHERSEQSSRQTHSGMGSTNPSTTSFIIAMPDLLEASRPEAVALVVTVLLGRLFLLHAFPDRFTARLPYPGLHPERDVVDENLRSRSRSSRRPGFVSAEAEDITRAIKPKPNP